MRSPPGIAADKSFEDSFLTEPEAIRGASAGAELRYSSRLDDDSKQVQCGQLYLMFGLHDTFVFVWTVKKGCMQKSPLLLDARVRY